MGNRMADGRMEKEDACSEFGRLGKELKAIYPHAFTEQQSKIYYAIREQHGQLSSLACDTQRSDPKKSQPAGLEKSEVVRIYKKAREIHARYKGLHSTYRGHRPEYEGLPPLDPSTRLRGIFHNFRQLGEKAGFVIEQIHRNRDDLASGELRKTLLDFERSLSKTEDENRESMEDLTHADLVIIGEHKLSHLFQVPPPRTPSAAYAFEASVLSLHTRIRDFDTLKEDWKCREIDEIGEELTNAVERYPYADGTSQYTRIKQGHERLKSDNRGQLACKQPDTDDGEVVEQVVACAARILLEQAVKRIAPPQRTYTDALARLADDSALRGVLKRPNMSRFARNTGALQHQLSETEWLRGKADRNPGAVLCDVFARLIDTLIASERLVNQAHGRLTHAEKEAVRGNFQSLQEEIRRAEEERRKKMVAKKSTGGFVDATVVLPLEFKIFDHGQEDGDIVTLEVRSANGVDVGPMDITLTKSGELFAPTVAEGPVEIKLIAVNEGSVSPNTGALNILSTVTDGPSNQEFNLKKGETGILRITAGR